MKLRHLPVTVIVVTEEWRLVDGALEDEPRPAGGAEGSGAERADGSEGVRPVRKRGLGPVLGCPLRADVAARHKTVSGGSSIYVHSRLTAQPQGHVGTHAPAQGTFSACCGPIALTWILLSLGSLAPVVASMDMAASEVDPGLTLFKADVTYQYQLDIVYRQTARDKIRSGQKIIPAFQDPYCHSFFYSMQTSKLFWLF